MDLEARHAKLEDLIIIEKLKKPEFTKEHVIFWLTRFKDGNVEDFEFKRALINTLVNAVYIYDAKEGDDRKVVIALNIKNSHTKRLESSDIQQMVRPMRLERTRAMPTTPSK